MLLLKGWLETRIRLLFPIGVFVLMVSLNPQGKAPVLPVVSMVAAILLAGSGIRTESAFRAVKGLEGSTYFTLALPVSRLRLFATRTGVGVAEASALIAGVCIVTGFLPLWSGHATVADDLRAAFVVFLCGSGYFGLSTFLATFLDQQWQNFVSMFCMFLVQWFFNRHWLPASMNLWAAMLGASPLVHHALPWAAMGMSVGAAVVFMGASVAVVQMREY